MGRGRIFGYWKSGKEALAESSVLPGTSRVAFAFATPPAVGRISNLAQAEAVLDYWQVTERALVDSMVRLRSAEIEDERAAKQKTGGLERSRAFWRAGGSAETKRFRTKTESARRHVEAGKATLAGLASQDRDADHSGEGKAIVQPAVRKAVTALAAARTDLAGLGPEAALLVERIDGVDRKLSKRAREALKHKAPASWWQRAAVAVDGAVGSFVEGLKNPENWKLALELGLEIAGNLATGGLALAARVVKWLVDAGGALKEPLGAVVSAIKTLTSKGGLASLLPVDRLFSLARLETLAVDALFGRVQKPASKLDGAGTKKSLQDKPAPTTKRRGFAAAAGALTSRIGGLYRGARDGVYGLLGWLDISREPWFAPFASAFARVARLGKKATGLVGLAERARAWVAGAREKLGDYADGLKAQIDNILDTLARPGAQIASWSQGLVNAGMGVLLRFLITKPPSAALKVALRLAGSVVNLEPEAIIGWVRSSIPGADTMISAIEKTAAETIERAVEKPVATVHKEAASFVAATALPAIDGARSAFDDALTQVEGRVQKVVASRGSGDNEKESPVKVGQSVEAGTRQKKHDDRVVGQRGDRSQKERKTVLPKEKRIQRQPETVLILIQQNAIDFSRRTELIRQIGGEGAFQAPEGRFVNLGTGIRPAAAMKRLQAIWPSSNTRQQRQRMQVLWGSFELIGTPTQLIAFLQEADAVLVGREQRSQGPKVMPFERTQAELLHRVFLGEAREVVFDLTGDEGTVRRKLGRWLIATRALSHLDNDQARVVWAPEASDFAWQQEVRGREKRLTDPRAFRNRILAMSAESKQRLGRAYPDLLRIVQDQGNAAVFMLCYEFVLYVAVRSGVLSATAVRNIYASDIAPQRRSTDPSKGERIYQLLGASGAHHRPFYVRPGSAIVRETPSFPGEAIDNHAGFLDGPVPHAGCPVFIWKNVGNQEVRNFVTSHVGLCVAPGLMVSLTYGRLGIETWEQLLARYVSSGSPVEGMTFGSSLA